MGLVTVLFLVTLVLVSVMTMTSVVTTSLRMTAGSEGRANALTLAEAGIDDTVDRLKSNSNYTGTGGAVTLYADPGTNSRPLGTFSVQVTTVASSAGLKMITSTGTAQGGATRVVNARWEGTEFNLGADAIRSNGDIDINGAVTVKTVPANLHTAHLRANQHIYLGNKTYDGGAFAHGTVSGTPYGAKVNNAPLMSFPSAATVAEWDTGWKASAQAGGTIAPPGSGIINGPRYINGDLSVGSHQTLVINGPGPVYVNGNVDLKGTLINNTQLIVKGKFDMGGQGEYDAASAPAVPMLISLSSAPDAIRYRGGAGSNQSIIYAANGGIDVAGNSECTGAMIAGGPGAEIVARGTFDLYYPYETIRDVTIGTPPSLTGWIEM
jgi:hypothetical protein